MVFEHAQRSKKWRTKGQTDVEVDIDIQIGRQIDPCREMLDQTTANPKYFKFLI